MVAGLCGESVTTAIAFDFGADCGIYDVGTPAWARWRGLGTALTAKQLHNAIARGCQTASLQARALYASVGFRDLGRILEFAPAQPETRQPGPPTSARAARLGTRPVSERRGR